MMSQLFPRDFNEKHICDNIIVTTVETRSDATCHNTFK